MLSSLHLIPMHADTALIKLLTLIVGIIILSFVIDFLLANSFFGGSYRIFVAPGIILHELSHALLCFFTGAKITQMSFFEKEGGSVKHKPSKIPILGPILISVAPFVFGAAAIFFISRKVGIDSPNLASVDISREGVILFFKTAVQSFNFKDIPTLVGLYLVLSIAVTMTPSFQDLRNMFLSLLAVALAVVVLIKFSVIHLSSIVIPSAVLTLLSTVLLLLILALFFSIIIFVISKIFKT